MTSKTIYLLVQPLLNNRSFDIIQCQESGKLFNFGEKFDFQMHIDIFRDF